MMAKMRHPNTVLFLGFCSEPPIVVTEYCSRGSLLECLRQVRAAAQASVACLHPAACMLHAAAQLRAAHCGDDALLAQLPA